MTSSKKEKTIEIACRMLISLQLILVIRGYIALLQTKYQLVSPLIPESILYDISYPYLMASLISAGMMLLTLWLYFTNKKIMTIIFASASLILHQTWILLFLK